MFAHKHHPFAPDILIEFAEKIHDHLDEIHGEVGYINKTAKLYYGHHAFREYYWLKGLAGHNKAGNLRGMVLDKRARGLFNLTVEIGEKLEKVDRVLLIAGWAIELSKSKNYIKQVLDSPTDPATKMQKVCAEVSMATIRALTGVIPAGTHAVASTLLKGVHRIPALQSWSTNINRADLWVNSHYKQITNTDNVVHYINTNTVLNGDWLSR